MSVKKKQTHYTLAVQKTFKIISERWKEKNHNQKHPYVCIFTTCLHISDVLHAQSSHWFSPSLSNEIFQLSCIVSITLWKHLNLESIAQSILQLAYAIFSASATHTNLLKNSLHNRVRSHGTQKRKMGGYTENRQTDKAASINNPNKTSIQWPPHTRIF